MTEPTTAQEILRAMAATYGRCRTYRDSGLHVTHFYREGRPPRADEKPFRTAFVRPDRFRFEYRYRLIPTAPERRVVVCARGDEVASYDLHESCASRAEASLRGALEPLGAVSSRLSWMVPVILLPSWGNGKPWRLLDLVRLDDAEVEGVGCYRASENGLDRSPPFGYRCRA